MVQGHFEGISKHGANDLWNQGRIGPDKKTRGYRGKRESKKLRKTTDSNAEKAGAVLRGDPSSPLRRIATQTKLKRTTASSILEKKPIEKCLEKVTAQKLAGNHPARRISACRGLLEEMERGALGRREIFRTDGKLFRAGREASQSNQYFRVLVDKEPKKRDVAPIDIVRGETQGCFSAMVAMGVCYEWMGTLVVVEKGWR